MCMYLAMHLMGCKFLVTQASSTVAVGKTYLSNPKLLPGLHCCQNHHFAICYKHSLHTHLVPVKPMSATLSTIETTYNLAAALQKALAVDIGQPKRDSCVVQQCPTWQVESMQGASNPVPASKKQKETRCQHRAKRRKLLAQVSGGIEKAVVKEVV